MTREVAGTIPIVEGQTASFVLCDRYERPLNVDPVACIVGTGGTFSAVLEVTGTERCYTVMTDAGKAVFWVYEGMGIQTVDLTSENYPRNAIDVFTYADPAEAVHNASALIGKVVCGKPIINEEEQRLVCRYENYASGEEDKEMCAIDTGVGAMNG